MLCGGVRIDTVFLFIVGEVLRKVVMCKKVNRHSILFFYCKGRCQGSLFCV